MANMIVTLLSQYELLERCAHFLSTLDLFHLALTNSELFTLIRKSDRIFNRLKSVALCDGHGLKVRQDFGGLYELRPVHFVWGKRRRYDEELEVRVWNVTCDEANGLPCLKCGVNVCEECRYVPRVRDLPQHRAFPRQHHLPYPDPNVIICFCAACDMKVQQSLPLSLSQHCDCNQYTRWICLPCGVEEDRMNTEYFKTRTQYFGHGVNDPEQGMSQEMVFGSLSFWCPCGQRAPKNGNIRCAWCKRKHNLDTWKDGDPSHIPTFDDDPCYPKYAEDMMGNQIMYPPLEYTGPISE